MSMRRILVSGAGAAAAMVGALVARRCAGPVCEVVIALGDDPRGHDEMLARPDCHRFHHEIGLDPSASARPAFAAEIAAHGESALIPFAPAGVARGGAEFHHYWLRASALAKQPPIAQFSPALQLAQRAGGMTLAQAEQTGVEHGLVIKRADYAALLVQQARSLGAKLVDDESLPDATLHITCGDEAGSSSWHDADVQMGAAPAIPGLDWQAAYNATSRLLALSADPANSAAEQREFNRLCAAEAERMEDFASFALAASPLVTQRPALRRKIEVFQACGRIPLEDYEVLAAHEWLALFWARGLRPLRHDRLADVLAQAELLPWMQQLYGQASAAARQEQTL